MKSFSKISGLFLITVLLFSSVILLIQVSLVTANPVIPEKIALEKGYIRGNGEVEPSTLPIEHEGNKYILKDNISNYTLDIQKDNVILDGNGFSFSLYPSDDKYWEPKTGSPFIQILNRTNIIVNNIRFINNYTYANFFKDIDVTNSSNILIIQNSMYKVGLGITLTSSRNCSVIGNQFIGNTNAGLLVSDSFYCKIENNDFSMNFQGIELANLKYSNFSYNNFFENERAIYFQENNYMNNVFKNNFTQNTFGLCYPGNPHERLPSNTQNKVYNNYWNDNYQNIEKTNADAISGQDQSPLANPVTILFDPIVPIASLIATFPTPSVVFMDEILPFTYVVVLALLLILIIVGSALSVAYYRKNQKCKQVAVRYLKSSKTQFFFTAFEGNDYLMPV